MLPIWGVTCLIFGVFSFATGYGAQQKSIRIATINAGDLLKFEHGLPSGEAYYYVKTLMKKAGYPSQKWLEVPYLRMKTVSLVAQYDVLFPYDFGASQNIFITKEVGVINHRLYLMSKPKGKRRLKIFSRPGLEQLVNRSKVLKNYDFQLQVLSGSNIIDRLINMGTQKRIDGFIADSFHYQEISKKIPSVYSVDLKTPYKLRLGFRKDSIDLTKITSEIDRIGTFNNFFAKFHKSLQSLVPDQQNDVSGQN